MKVIDRNKFSIDYIYKLLFNFYMKKSDIELILFESDSRCFIDLVLSTKCHKYYELKLKTIKRKIRQLKLLRNNLYDEEIKNYITPRENKIKIYR